MQVRGDKYRLQVPTCGPGTEPRTVALLLRSTALPLTTRDPTTYDGRVVESPRHLAILVVDDDPLVRRALIRELTSAFSVVEAATVAEARMTLDRLPVVAVVTDYEIRASENGLVLLSEARRRDERILRVLLTGSQLGRDVDEALENGVIERLVEKPWKPYALLEYIRNALATNSRARGQS